MKWCRIEVDGKPAFGIVEGADIALLDAAPYEQHKRTGRKVALKSAKFLPPVMPYNFYAAGINFRAHIEWAAQRLGMALKPPAQADIGYRSPNALVGSGADIVVPKDSPGPVHFEGELVAVIGKRAKHLTEANALDCVAGYTLGNDLSERSFQKSDRTLWPGDVIWLGCDGPTLPALDHGDLVEVVNDAIGVLANRVVKT